jgi:hypothetical protein
VGEMMILVLSLLSSTFVKFVDVLLIALLFALDADETDDEIDDETDDEPSVSMYALMRTTKVINFLSIEVLSATLNPQFNRHLNEKKWVSKKVRKFEVDLFLKFLQLIFRIRLIYCLSFSPHPFGSATYLYVQV